ncbi:MAG: aminotransferase class IV, partial [Chloroflexota bacterium]|nr:aminotransferase class IV [Chloroflexota bacterium]
MASERVAYVNGEIVPESRASISIHDRGFLQGYSVFDTTRTFNHKIFKLDEHLHRFYNSLKYARLDPGMDISQMAQITMQVLETNLPLINNDDDYWVTQRVSRG